jgi:putative ABC transport system permease protein
VMVAVSVVGTTYVAKSLLQQETHVQTHRRTSAGFVLQASSAEGLPTAVEDAARHNSGVTSVTGTVATTAVVAGDGHLVSVPARTVVPGAIGRGLALEVAAGSLEHVRDDGVAVSVRSAHDWGWRLGERVRIRLGDGSAVGVRVVAEYRRPLGFGELVLPRALVAGHVTRPLDDAVYVTAAPAGRRDVEHALRDLRGTYPTLRVLTPDSYVAQIDAAGTKEALEVYVLLALIVLFCALGLVNALTMAVGARSREFATLLLIGATRRQVRSMVRTETLTTLAFGLIVGSLVAFPGLALLEHSLRGSWRPSIPVWTCLGLFASYAVIGMAATVIPLRAALRAATAGAAS